MVKLYKHQEQVLQQTKKHNRVAYYLDMGLGKTFVGSEKMNELGENINVLVCQKSKINDWAVHFKTFYPDYKIVILNKQPIGPVVGKIIYIINYDLSWRRTQLLNLKNFTLMLDESSLIKNMKSNRTSFILKLKAKNVILLSGTPVGGKYEELYSQIKLLGWDISKKLFYHQYVITKKFDIGGFPIEKVIGYKNIDRLKEKLREHGAVFMKTDDVFDLPPIREIIIPVAATRSYRIFKKNKLVKIKDLEIVGDTSLTNMLGQRQLAAMYSDVKYEKLQSLMESTEDRLIIFYNFNEECSKIKRICEKLNKPVSEVNGKDKNLSNYENCNDSITLIQYQAGAMGLNLQKANKIIYFSLPLQSELFEQSKKRIHRIGQVNKCIYYYLISNETIEEKIHQTLKERKDFTDILFKEMEEAE